MKKLGLVVSMVVMVLFTSCSKNDGDLSIQGTEWRITEVQYEDYDWIKYNDQVTHIRFSDTQIIIYANVDKGIYTRTYPVDSISGLIYYYSKRINSYSYNDTIETYSYNDATFEITHFVDNKIQVKQKKLKYNSIDRIQIKRYKCE
jgi:hypothetical protein